MPYGKLVGAALIAGVHRLGGAEIVSHLLLCPVIVFSQFTHDLYICFLHRFLPFPVPECGVDFSLPEITIHSIHPHAHSSPLCGFSPAPYGAKTAYVGGVTASQSHIKLGSRCLRASTTHL